MANENKWEYDYSSQNNTGGTDTGYPNVGSSGMNTANQYNDPQPQYTAPNVPPMPDAGAGGVTPPVYPAQPQQAQPQAEAAPAENSKSRRRRRRKSQQRQDGAAE